MAMPGVTFKEIQDAIIDAYEEPDLKQVLRREMNVRMDVEVPPGAFGDRVFELVQWAEQRGREVELVQVTARDRPRKVSMQEIYRKYGLAIPVFVQEAGVAKPGAPSDAASSGLEALVNPYLKIVDIDLWKDK